MDGIIETDLALLSPMSSSSALDPVHHDQHASNPHETNSERFRRIDDRINELQSQMIATQTMIRELSEFIYKQHRATSVKQTFRSLSNKVLHGGPTRSFISAANTLNMQDAEFDPAQQDEILDTTPMGQSDEETRHQEYTDTVDSVLPPRRQSASDDPANRRLSASNPIALQGAKSDSRKTSVKVAQAISHAAAFVQAAKQVSIKKLKADGPMVPTRRFSISTLDLSNARDKDSRVSRFVIWSKNLLFKKRVEPAVTPEEILEARAVGQKVHRLTIRHDSPGRSLWDVIVMVMILIDITFTPLSLSFRYEARWLDYFNAIATIIFGTDFFVNMMSSYTTTRGELVSGPSNTIRHYFVSVWALPDFLSWFPFDLFFSDQGRVLGVAKVIRLAKISQLARRLHSARKAGFFRFVRLLGIVFIVSHILACYWNWVADVWRETEDGYLDKPLGSKYAHCWSLVIGCLNASPPTMHTPMEEISVAVFMLMGNVLQASVFGAVAVVISSFDEDEVEYNRKLIMTYERCRFLDIPEPLARRIQGYYENLYRETRSVNPDADSFINELSPALICEVKFQLYRDMITQIPFLSATHINPVVIEMLILHLRTVIYMQDDVLIRKGEFGDWMGFIGSKGSVGVLDPNSQSRKIIRILRKGDYFGEMALLQRAKRSTTAVALSWVQIHVLCRNDLDDVKDQYPDQAEILEQEITKYMKTKVTYK